MKKMLIAGGGYADIPLILAAKRTGFYVITIGNRPQDLGHAYSDEYHNVDFSDCDAVFQLAKGAGVSFICPCCNDFSALSAAYTAEKLGLPGHDSYETARILHHKDRYRKFALDHGIPSPMAVGCHTMEDVVQASEVLGFPVVIKSVDLTGGKGIFVVDNMKAALSAGEEALAISKAKRIVVEEFIHGSRHGFSAFLYKRKVCFYFADNEYYYLNPYMVSAASAPSTVCEKVKQQLCRELEKIASLLALKDGILHMQYILTETGPVIIEVCRRAPGDLYIKFVEHTTWVDYSSWIVKASAGIDCAGLEHVEPRGFFTRHCVMGSQAGRVKDVVFDASIKDNIIEKFMWWKEGDNISNVLTDKLGIVFLRFVSMREMVEKTEKLNDLINIRMSSA